MTTRAYARVDLGKDSSGRPLVVNARTRDMLRAVEAMLQTRLTLVQGSYRAGAGASASAGTHDGGGVVDIRTWDLPGKGLTPEQVVLALRRAGFAAWFRTKAQGFDPHIHAVAIGDKQLHPTAKAQVEAYYRGRNGLANNGRDDGPRLSKIRTWPQVKRRARIRRPAWWRRYRQARRA